MRDFQQDGHIENGVITAITYTAARRTVEILCPPALEASNVHVQRIAESIGAGAALIDVYLARPGVEPRLVRRYERLDIGWRRVPVRS